MKLLSTSSAGDIFGSAVAILLNAALVHAVTDFGVPGSIFFGYVLVEIFVTSSRLKSAAYELESTNRELVVANQRIDLLEARLINLSESVLR